MQRERHQAITGRKAGRRETSQVKRRTAGHDYFCELLAFSLEWRLLIDRMLNVGDVEKRRAQ
jgi:hypothetical protein